MATIIKSDFPSSPANDESDLEGEEEPVDEAGDETVAAPQPKPANNNVSDILKRLQFSGAILKKPKEEYRCHTCDEDFRDWEELENHLIQHVSLPSIVISKLPSDDEDALPSGDDWSDEEEEAPPPPTTPIKTPQKIDISQLKNLSVKKQGQANTPTSDSALSKLSGLGFTIKKNVSPIKQENPEPEKPDANIMEKLGKLGGIKLKLKSDGASTNSFKVVNGLKDFRASDDEEDEDKPDEGDEDKPDEGDEDEDQGDKDESGGEQQDKSRSDEDEIPIATRKITNAIKNAVNKKMSKPDSTPVLQEVKQEVPAKPVQVQQGPAKRGRPAVKQTPRRDANHPLAAKQIQPTQGKDISTTYSTPERRESHGSNPENFVVKQELDTGNEAQSSSNVPLFSSGPIKTEHASPPPTDSAPTSTPIISKIKTEAPDTNQQPQIQNKSAPNIPSSIAATTPLLPVAKTEDTDVTIIEINGDSNDEDDDCCVVSATPAPDVKPVIPKTEVVPPASYSLPAYSSTQSSFGSSSVLSARLSAPSTEKQHTFNWNAPDSKPPLDLLGKSSDDLFDSFMSTSKRENSSIGSDAEFISLDTLGAQHTCDVCNTRFTSLSLLDDHKRMTGHSTSLVAPSSSIIPYSSSSNLLSHLLPVKQLAEQVGKLSTIGGSGPGFTHQQNVMINIQAYPGAGGVMGPPPAYVNAYPGQNMHQGYQQAPNNMYPGQAMPGQQMPGMPSQQFQPQSFMGQPPGFGQQFQPPMSKAGYPGSMPPTSLYSTASPLQSMQQAVYGQSPSGGMTTQMGQMGPPGSSPSHSYIPASSPSGVMKPPPPVGNVRIQNVQTFVPGQMVGQPLTDMSQMGAPGQGQMGPPGQTASGQPVGNQMPSPGPIRMAPGANIAGPRPRMPNVRGVRPTIRPGIHVHGQVRGARPRMPIKRPAGTVGAGPGQKRRNDMLLPGKHDTDECHVMSLQKQRDGLPMISSVQGAKDKLNLGSQISVTKKTVNKEASAMANVLASRGISIKQKQKSRSPSPERPVPHIPNLGSAVSIKHTSKSSNFSIPEAKVGGGMQACKICRKMFMNVNSLSVHMTNAHPGVKINAFKCDECPASYPTSLQLQHHKRAFHNVQGPNKELGLPVVDLSQEENVKRLSNLGIYSFIPLANKERTPGCFGIPVISVHNMQNGITSGLQALGADGLLSLGPLKSLPNT